MNINSMKMRGIEMAVETRDRKANVALMVLLVGILSYRWNFVVA